MYNDKPPELSPELPSPPYPMSVKRATLESLLNISYWLWRLNPSLILPVMLSSAVGVLKQSVIVIALLFSLSQLAASGVFWTLADAIRTRDLEMLVSTLSSVAPAIMSVIAVSFFIFFLVSILAGGFLISAEYGSYLRLVQRGMLSIEDIFEEMGTRWTKMAWTVLIVETIRMGPVMIALALTTFDILRLSLLDTSRLQYSFLITDRLIFWLGFILLAMVLTLILMILTTYAYPAAADDSFGFASIRRSVSVCMKLPTDTVLYCAFRAFSLTLIGIVSSTANSLGFQISSITIIVLSFLLTPVFHLFKTAIFLKVKPEEVMMPLPVGPPVLGDIFPHVMRTGFESVERGFRELVIFLLKPRNIVFHIFSVMAFSLGAILGKQLSSSGIRQIVYALGYVPGEAGSLFKTTYGLPFLALNIFFHNWQVSLATALSGIIFIAPVLVTLAFNGFILGVIADIFQNQVLFLSAILPHGVIELPAFIIAGSAGLSLGFEFLMALKEGSLSSNPELSKALAGTIYITLGLIPLFILAGLIETFITPYVMRSFGWG